MLTMNIQLKLSQKSVRLVLLPSLSFLSLSLSLSLFSFLLAVLVTSAAQALPEPKLVVTYSLEAADGGLYSQKISETPLGIGDVDYVYDVLDSGDPNVNVLVDSPLSVTIEYTADAPGGNIVDGPVELTDVHFEREFEIDTGATFVETVISTVLARKGTGTLAGTTITWDNVVAPYQEAVIGASVCAGFGCGLVDPNNPFPRDLDGTLDVPLPTFTVLTNIVFGDSFASDNGTAGDPSDDIDRPDTDATVKDTWVPEPTSGSLLAAGLSGLMGLGLLNKRQALASSKAHADR